MSTPRIGLLLFCLLMLTLPACSSNDRTKLSGRWQSIDATRTCSLRFDGDGRVTIYLADGRNLDGKYTLLASDFVEVELNESWNGMVNHRERIFVDGSELTLRDADGTTLRFRRQY
jgi:hypothetical protein